MADDALDAAAAKVLQGQDTAAPEAPTEGSDLDAIAASVVGQQPDIEKKTALAKWAGSIGGKVPPGQQAEILKLSAATGFPAEYVQGNLDTVRQFAANERVDYHQLMRDHPVLADYMQDPVKAGLVRDDVANLSGIEWALTGKWETWQSKPGEKSEQGTEFTPGTTRRRLVTPPFWGAILRDATRQAELGFRQSWEYARRMAGAEPRADTPEIAELRAKVPGVKDYGIGDIPNPYVRELARAFGFVTEMAPLVAGTVVSAAAGGAAGGPAGAVAAPLVFNFGLGVGPGYDAMQQKLKAEGKQGDPDAEEAALFWGTMGGTANAALMTAGLGPIGSGVKAIARQAGLDTLKDAGTAGVQKVLTDATVGQVLRRGALHYGKEWAGGTATMAAMAGVSAATQEAFASKVDNREFHAAQVGEAMAEAARNAASGMALLSALSFPVRRYAQELGKVAELSRNAQCLEAAVEAARASKTTDLAPEQAQALIASMAGREGASVYVERAEFDRLYQEKGLDPRAVAAEVIGDGGKAYDEAVATGQDVAFPADAYLTRLARTDLGLEIADVSRFSQAERTPRQQRAEAVRVGRKIKEQADAAIKAGQKAPAEAIAEDFKAQALAAGRPELEARANAEIVARSYTWFGAESGQDPMALYREVFPVRVHKGGEAAQGDMTQVRLEPPQAEWSRLHDLLLALDRAKTAGLTEEAARIEKLLGRADPAAIEAATAGAVFPPGANPVDVFVQSPKEYGGIHRPPGVGSGAPLHDLTGGGEVYPADVYGPNAVRYYGHGDPALDMQTIAIVQRLHGKSDSEVTIYRAVPKGIENAAINPGDWVTINRAYAKAHGERFAEGYDILAKKVRAGEVYTNGDSIHEYGYWPPGSEAMRQEVRLKTRTGDRGFVRLSADIGGKTVSGDIHLLSPDPSTLPHELTHFFTEVMARLAAQDGSSPSLKESYQTLLRAMDFTSNREREVAAAERKDLAAKEKRTPAEAARLKELTAREERIPHQFEQFLSEGRAPSKELMPVFARWRRWMARLYGAEGVQEQFRRTYGEDLALGEPVRDVFRRLLAGEDAVAEAARQHEAEMPKVALTPQEQKESDKLQEEARAEAEANVHRLLVSEERGADREFMKSERERIRAEVDAEVGKTKVYAAIDALRGVGPGIPATLDRAAVVKEFGATVADALPKGTVAKENGYPTEVAADFLGFESGKDLVQALMAAEDRQRVVARETAKRMRDLYPPLSDRPDTLAKVARSEMTNDPAIRDGVLRLRAMAREAGIQISVPTAKELKDAAQNLVAGRTYAELRPDRFDVAAKAAAKRAAEAKDPRKRTDEFESYLFNRALARAATDARVEIEKAAAALNRYTRPDVLAKIGLAIEKVPQSDGTEKIAQPYRETLENLLAAFDFKASASLREVRNREAEAAALKTWVAERWADGDSVIVPDSVLEKLARSTHWKDLTLPEIQDLRTAADSIAQQADLRTKFRLGEQSVAMSRVVDELVAGVFEAAKAKGIIGTGEPISNPLGGEHLRSTGNKAKGVGRKALFAIERPEELVRQLGPAWVRYYWRPLSDASYRFYDLQRESAAKIIELLRDLPAEDRARIKDTRFEVDGQTYSIENAIAVALNSGNESNEAKIIRGMSMPGLKTLFNEQPWNGKGTRDAILSHLTARDVEIANTIVRALESYWEKSKALELEMTGAAPPKVEARPLKFKNLAGEELTLEGGYYPIIYSRKFARVGKVQSEADSLAANGLPGLFNPGYDRAMTPQSHLEARVESYARPFDLTLDALPRKLTMTAKDVAFRRDAVQLYRVMTDEKVVGALTQTIGEEGYNVLMHHLQDSVNDVMLPDVGAGLALRAISQLRGLVSQNIFTLSVPQTLQNLASFARAYGGTTPAAKVSEATLRFARSPVEEWRKIVAESPEMRIRDDSISASLSNGMEDTFRKSEIRMKWGQAKELMMLPFETTNRAVEGPVYLGAKEHALAPKESGGLGMSEKDAINHAEAEVRASFGGKRTVDLPPVMRDKILRHFTMFHGWANAQLTHFIKAASEGRVLWHEGMTAKALKAVGAAYATLVAQQLASDLLVGRGPEDYDQDGKIDGADWGHWAISRAMFTLPLTMPFIGSAARSLDGKQSRDVSLTPWMNLINTGVRTVNKSASMLNDVAEGATDEDKEIATFLAWLELGGAATGAPSQVVQTARYWTDPARDPNAGAVQDVLGTFYGRPRPGKLSTAIQEAP